MSTSVMLPVIGTVMVLLTPVVLLSGMARPGEAQNDCAVRKLAIAGEAVPQPFCGTTRQ